MFISKKKSEELQNAAHERGMKAGMRTAIVAVRAEQAHYQRNSEHTRNTKSAVDAMCNRIRRALESLT